jgi:hypothetical protein
VHALVSAAIIVVRIYNYAGVPAEELASAQATTAAIFQSTAIAVEWNSCRVPGSDEGMPCEGPLGTNELIVRLMDSSAGVVRGPLAMGSSLIETDTGQGVLATIDPRLTGSIAEQSGMDAATMLGRAVAHELGHLLLANPGHSETGLMRALWSQAELRRNRSFDWVFSAQEADTMRHRLGARSHSAN